MCGCTFASLMEWSGVAGERTRSRATAFLRLMRPHQWSKNGVVLAGVAFSGQADEPDQLMRAVVAVVAFCLVSSAVYVFNDWHDRAEDRIHPTKHRRPVAAREVHPPVAVAFSGALLGASLIVAATISPDLAGVVAAYAAMMVTYTLWLRRLPVADILTIALGFVLRAFAGAVAVAVPLSVWLFVCTLMLALMLGLGKRRHELRMLRWEIGNHRPSLAGYARFDMDRTIGTVGLLTIGSYTLYALAVPTYGRDLPMFLTVPFVVIAIVRYLVLVFRDNLGGTPEVLLVRDRLLLLSIVAWSIAVGVVLAS